MLNDFWQKGVTHLLHIQETNAQINLLLYKKDGTNNPSLLIDKECKSSWPKAEIKPETIVEILNYYFKGTIRDKIEKTIKPNLKNKTLPLNPHPYSEWFHDIKNTSPNCFSGGQQEKSKLLIDLHLLLKDTMAVIDSIEMSSSILDSETKLMYKRLLGLAFYIKDTVENRVVKNQKKLWDSINSNLQYYIRRGLGIDDKLNINVALLKNHNLFTNNVELKFNFDPEDEGTPKIEILLLEKFLDDLSWIKKITIVTKSKSNDLFSGSHYRNKKIFISSK